MRLHELFNILSIILLIKNSSGFFYANNVSMFGYFKVSKFEIKLCETVMKPQKYSHISIKNMFADDGRPIAMINLTITRDVGPLMGKISVSKIVNDKHNKVLQINQDNLCKYAFPLKLLPFTLKVDNKCIAKPASYIDQIIDIQTLVYGFIGKKGLYGTFNIKLEWFSKKYMGVCLDCIQQNSPI